MKSPVPSLKLKLYHYWRSTSSWRVRWAMIHQQIPVEWIAVSLLDGESESPEHLKRDPRGFVPVLEIHEAGAPIRWLSESLAIIQWCQDRFFESPRLGKSGSPTDLWPTDPWLKAVATQLAETINAGTQPLANLTTLEQLSQVVQNPTQDVQIRKEWAQHWIERGLQAYEALAKPYAGRFSIGDTLTIADLCLAPQIYGAQRNDVEISQFPTIARIHGELQALESYQRSHPDRFEPQKS